MQLLLGRFSLVLAGWEVALNLHLCGCPITSTVAFCHDPCVFDIPVSPQLAIFINPVVVNKFACLNVPNSPGVSASEPYSSLLPSVLPAHGQTMLYVCPSVRGCPRLLGFMYPACYCCDLCVGQTVVFLGLMPSTSAVVFRTQTQIVWISSCPGSGQSA